MTYKTAYNIFTYGVSFGLFIIGLEISIWGFTGIQSNDPASIAIKIVLPVLTGIYCFFVIISGFKQIGPDEIGIVLQFGKPIFQVGSGLVFIPFPAIWRLHKETRLVIEEQYPEDDSSNKTTPIFITHGTSPIQSLDPLDNRITTTVSIVCRYKIVDLETFITTIGNKDQLRRQVKDIVITTTQIECAKETVGKNYNRLNEINSKLKTAVEELTNDWGVKIVNVILQNIDLGGAINEALRNVPISIINKEINKNNAQKIYYEGLAEADVHKAFQYAKAEGYKIIAKELNVPEPQIIYQIDTLANMWRKNNADINLYSGDLSEIFKMVTAFSKIMGNNSNNKLSN